jgi:hypothetical protein
MTFAILNAELLRQRDVIPKFREVPPSARLALLLLLSAPYASTLSLVRDAPRQSLTALRATTPGGDS